MTTTIRSATYEEAFEIAENYAYEGNIVKGPYMGYNDWYIIVESTT
jgi:hypothetical protein